MTNIKSLLSHSEVTDGTKTKSSHSAFADFLDAAVISGVEDPINAGEQLINHATGKHLPKIELVVRPGNTWATKAGSIVGGLVDVAVVSVGVASGVAEVGLAAGVGTSILSSAGVGLVYSATRPTSEKGNFWLNKGRDVAITTGTFAALGALAPGPESHAMMRPSKVEVLADPPFQIDADGKGITVEGQPIGRTLLDMQYQMHRKAPTQMLSWTETAQAHMRLGDYNSEFSTTGAPSQDEIDSAIEKTFPYCQHLDDGQVREADIGNGLVVHQHISIHDDAATLITTKLFNLFPHAQHLLR
jgi:hypothetical protein